MTITPADAGLAKVFTNIWRYIKIATANQLYMMANDRRSGLASTVIAQW